IMPGITHWNHPAFFAYFAISGSRPGILGEALSAALNVNAMLWKSSPAATELEEKVCDWLRRLLDLPEGFRGHINDTASMSSLLALAAARHRLAEYDIRGRGMAGRSDLPALVVYANEQVHSSIDKAMILLGLGHENVRRVATDEAFRMDPAALAAAIEEDLAAGRRPLAVVATVGTTSTTAIDPVDEIAAICRRHDLWLHVDGAYGGSAGICPEIRARMPGLELADSIVVNPHKWLFVPVDCSVLYVQDLAGFKSAFSLLPEYLKTPENTAEDAARPTDLMDLGVQLGRRFRALKMWMVFRAFGAEGLRARIREHCRLARLFAGWVAADPRFELAAPVPFSLVCFRAVAAQDPQSQDRLNEALLARVNAAGPVFLSHTKLHDRIVLRLAVGNIKTTEAHVRRAWELLQEGVEALSQES
ncbi:MAG: amino acid decarboxylase, partial [Acidobacteria bacterium]|nr:amino acid decarboxylase [Acidobacteriota bacterium]